MSEFEASQYDVPHWDCPKCGGVNDGFGQDDLTGTQECDDCGAEVTVS